MPSDPTAVRPDGDQLAREQNTDAQLWAQACADALFQRQRRSTISPNHQNTEDLLVGWFANAMMAMHDSQINNRRRELAAMSDQEARSAAEQEWNQARAEQELISGPHPEGSVDTGATGPNAGPCPICGMRVALPLLEGHLKLHDRRKETPEPVISTDARQRVLADWWLQRADAEIDMVVAKAVEYGAGDLVEIGRHLVQAGVRPAPEGLAYSDPTAPVDSQMYYAELGCYFYICGKMARWTSAIQEGRPVSNDTILDIGVYVRMVQRIREAGEWPGV